MKSLTPPEIIEFEKLEKVVEAGHKTFVEVGLALTEIRDRKLYQKDFDTFEEYCQKRWKWTRRRSNQLIEAAAVVESLTPDLGTAVPNEAVARELGKLPIPQRKEIAEEAIKSSRPLTAPAVRKHIPPPTVVPAPPIIAKSEPVAAVLDGTGLPISQYLLPIWERRHEAQEMMSTVSKLRSAIRKAQDEKDVLFARVNFSALMAHLDNSYDEIKCAKPYAVCLCQGKNSDACRLCRGLGFISEFLWNSGAITEEQREFRKKQVADKL